MVKSKPGVSLSSMIGIHKLELLRSHYECLGKVGVDDNFEADRKEVVSLLKTCISLSEVE